nr:EZH inhibitory protein [Gorilla gorilla gorilla]
MMRYHSYDNVTQYGERDFADELCSQISEPRNKEVDLCGPDLTTRVDPRGLEHTLRVDDRRLALGCTAPDWTAPGKREESSDVQLANQSRGLAGLHPPSCSTSSHSPPAEVAAALLLSEGEPGVVATQSDMEKEQKHQQDEVQGGLNNETALASGDACGTGNQDPAASVTTVSSQASPSGGAALSSSTAGSSAAAATSAAIFITDEASGLPIIAAVLTERHSDRQDGRSPHEVFGCVVPEGGSQAAVGPQKATGQADEHLAQTKSPGNSRRRKQPCRNQAAPAQKPPGRRLFPEPLPPSSPGFRPSSYPCSGASTSSQATQPSPALLSHASEARPATQSRITLVASALRRRASGPGPVIRRCTAQPGPAFPRRATHLDPARLSPESAPGPARRGRASVPGPAPRGRDSAPGSARRGRDSAPGPALRVRTARSEPGHRSTSTTPGTGLRSISTQQRSALLSRRSLSGSADENPSCGTGSERLAFQSRSGSPDPEVPSRASPPVWHAVRMRASSPSPPGRFFLPIPQQWDESSSSSYASNSSSPSRSSGLSPSSPSPEFLGLRSISTPSPESLRYALMPEFYALSPVPPEEQAEIESTAHPATPPEP